MCLQKTDDSWAPEANWYETKLIVEAQKTDNSGGQQKFIHQFFVYVQLDGSNNVTDCKDFISPAQACSTPTCGTLTQTANSKNFTTSWSKGRCNGGPDGCKIQYAVNNSWYDTGVKVDCDQNYFNFSSALPEAFLSGKAWSDWVHAGGHDISIRLTRVVDGSTMCTFATPMTCVPTSGSVTSTPTVDEDCNGIFDEYNPGVSPHYY